MIDPRHEETAPAGDAPYWAKGYDLAVADHDQDANHEYARFVLRMIGVGMAVLFAAIAIGLASMLFAWGKDMPKGPFLGGAPEIQYYPFGHSGENQSPLHTWFDSLKSRKGLCCSFADGVSVADIDWDTKGGRYRVRLDGRWITVPDAAVVTEPNRFGRAVVWPYQDGTGVMQIRCFIPGSGA